MAELGGTETGDERQVLEINHKNAVRVSGMKKKLEEKRNTWLLHICSTSCTHNPTW